MELYVRLSFPEYQKYEEIDDFQSHSHFCPESNEYFVEYEWLSAHKGGGGDILEKALAYVRSRVDIIAIHAASNKMEKGGCSLESADYSLYSDIRDCLDTFGDDNELPELWYDEYGGIEDIFMNL